MKKLLFICLLTVAVIMCFSSCSRIEKSAVILNDNASEIINRVFYESNYVRGAYYGTDLVFEDEAYPQNRYFIVRNEEELNKIFTSNTGINVDFSSEMLVIYTFRADYVRPIELEKLHVDNDRIYIELNMEQKRRIFEMPRGDACTPFQRYVVIGMSRSDVSEVEVNVKS
jgi:hypothetical protein